jgi:hypothetical protein
MGVKKETLTVEQITVELHQIETTLATIEILSGETVVTTIVDKPTQEDATVADPIMIEITPQINAALADLASKLKERREKLQAAIGHAVVKL